jgi:hypothetical protein
MKKLKHHHDILLHLLDELPEGEASALQAELIALFGTLMQQLDAVSDTQGLYDAVAGKIRAKASVYERRKVLCGGNRAAFIEQNGMPQKELCGNARE